MRYGNKIISEAKELRAKGKTYREIRIALNLKIPKSTFSTWLKNIELPDHYENKVSLLNFKNLEKARKISIQRNKERRKIQIKEYQDKNRGLIKNSNKINMAKIALAMLWLGEGSKTRGVFRFGSSDPRIIKLFLWGIKRCFQFDMTKVRCTVQCRADQNIEFLEKYWMNITNVPKKLFYKARIDPRTVGKTTQDLDYKGVLRVDYFDVKIQDEMATIVNMLYNQISNGPVVYR